MAGRGNQGGSLSFVRAVGFVSVVVWVLAVLVYLGRMVPPSDPEPPVAAGVLSPAGATSGHSLRIAIQRDSELRVTLDDAVVVDRRVERSEDFAWEGARTFTVEGAAPEALRIEWNGRRVVPLGRQDEPRRLVSGDREAALDVGRGESGPRLRESR